MNRHTRICSHKSSSSRLLEYLESRLLLSTYTPDQIRQAYGFNSLANNGAGQTIAIIDAYNDSHLAADLNAFDKAFSLDGNTSLFSQYGAANNFLTVNTIGSKTTSDPGWAMETALDVEWAHVIAPAAKIILVQAHSDSLGDLLAAVNVAKNNSSVSVVSMSWGAGEFSGETSSDSYFTTPSGHKGITFVASSGDNGAGTIWPSVATNVLSVGGTTLSLSGSNYAFESTWSDSGGGFSLYESKPSYQSAVNSTAKRANPDVAYDADPNTGFYVYDSNYYGQSGFWSVGGTSAGTPQWAALVALADQSRASAGNSSLTTAQTLAAIYSLPASDFHDVTAGSNGNPATTGYDLATGRGSPIANLLIPALASSNTASNKNVAQVSQSNTGTSTKTKGRHHFQLLPISFPLIPTPTVTSPQLTLAPLSTTLTLAALPTTFFSAHSLTTPAAPSIQARIEDPALPPSTDEILPASDTTDIPVEIVQPDPILFELWQA